MRIAVLLTLCMTLALTAGVGTASASGGNSEAAKACQKGGWQDWRRADQTPFANQGDCVSYAAQGGTLTAPKSAAQLLCESFGGTFGGPTTGIVWTCVFWQFSSLVELLTRISALEAQCVADGGVPLPTSISLTIASTQCNP